MYDKFSRNRRDDKLARNQKLSEREYAFGSSVRWIRKSGRVKRREEREERVREGGRVRGGSQGNKNARFIGREV
jgi:hypothetical protein